MSTALNELFDKTPSKQTLNARDALMSAARERILILDGSVAVTQIKAADQALPVLADVVSVPGGFPFARQGKAGKRVHVDKPANQIG